MMKNVPKEKEIFTFYAGNWLINERELIGLQVSDHIWKKPGRERITPELIQKLVKKLEIEGPFIPEGRKDDEEFFKLEPVWDDGKSYKLIWYLKDDDNCIWVRTCHPTKKKYKNNHEKK